jgi:hypothetical protein
LGDDLRAAQIRELSKADRKPGTTGCTIDTEMGQCIRDPRFPPPDSKDRGFGLTGHAPRPPTTEGIIINQTAALTR